MVSLFMDVNGQSTCAPRFKGPHPDPLEYELGSAMGKPEDVVSYEYNPNGYLGVMWRVNNC